MIGNIDGSYGPVRGTIEAASTGQDLVEARKAIITATERAVRLAQAAGTTLLTRLDTGELTFDKLDTDHSGTIDASEANKVLYEAINAARSAAPEE